MLKILLENLTNFYDKLYLNNKIFAVIWMYYNKRTAYTLNTNATHMCEGPFGVLMWAVKWLRNQHKTAWQVKEKNFTGKLDPFVLHNTFFFFMQCSCIQGSINYVFFQKNVMLILPSLRVHHCDKVAWVVFNAKLFSRIPFNTSV